MFHSDLLAHTQIARAHAKLCSAYVKPAHLNSDLLLVAQT